MTDVFKRSGFYLELSFERRIHEDGHTGGGCLVEEMYMLSSLTRSNDLFLLAGLSEISMKFEYTWTKYLSVDDCLRLGYQAY